ncbi:PEGA domain-containing protein [Candidatus Poribacteria bacterium]|nr:PEGA domain-containing protein [Candidatus Poribacteria bacterium]
MKLGYFICFIIIFVSALNSYAANAGYLWVNSEPKGAFIYLDGEYQNMMTPATKLIEAEAGRHKLELSKQGYKLYEKWQDFEEAKVLEVEILMADSDSEEESKTISIRYVEVYLTVRSDPPGSDVYLDGEFIGKTPVADYTILPGQEDNKKLLIEKKGYHSYEGIIYASDLKTRIKINVTQELRPVVAIPKLPSSDEKENQEGGFVINDQVLIFTAILIAIIIIIIVRMVILRKQDEQEK